MYREQCGEYDILRVEGEGGLRRGRERGGGGEKVIVEEHHSAGS